CGTTLSMISFRRGPRPLFPGSDFSRAALLLISGTLVLAHPARGADPDREPVAGNECVVLLHGLARTHRSMSRLAHAAEAVGYKTVNLDYASRGKPIEALAASIVPGALARCRELRA